MEPEPVNFKKKNKKSNKQNEDKLLNEIELLASKIDISIENFKFNVAIANFYEAYNTLKKYSNLDISNETLIKSLTKIVQLLLPVVPHLANEILDLLDCKVKNKWPSINKNFVEEIKFAIQINGKTRDILSVKKDLSEEKIIEIIGKESKVKKTLQDKKIIRTIFVKNKIINYIIK